MRERVETAIQLIDLYPVIPAEENAKTLQHTFIINVMAKLHFFFMPRFVYAYF